MASLSPLTGTLGRRRATHLLRRASFRFTKAKVDELAGKTAAQAVQILLSPSNLKVAEPLYGGTNNQNAVNPPVPWVDLHVSQQPAEDFVLRRFITSWWINEALQDNGIGFKMQFFLHQFNITDTVTAGNSNFWDYLKLIRFYKTGNFKKLITKMVADNVMLRYLNNNQNTAANPNENFAREFFELFTIGKGPQIGSGDYTNYTEDDIVACAKVMTGWRTASRNLDVAPYALTNLDPDTGIPAGQPRPNQHNWEEKKFTSKFQNLTIPAVTVASQKTQQKMRDELQLLVDRVFAQDETAKNFCRRLYHYFVSRNISAEIETDIIKPLATTFKNNNFDIAPVLSQLFASQHFFDADDSENKDEIVGGLIKSPLDLALQSMSFFGLAIPDPVTQNLQHYATLFNSSVQNYILQPAGLPLFYPDNVAGYPAYYQEPDFNRSWFNSATIITRYKLGQMLLTGKRINGGQLGTKLNIATWVKNSGTITDPSDPYVLVSDLIDYLMPEKPDDKRFNYFYNTVFLDNLPPYDWTLEWNNYLTSGNATEVTIPLERLIQELMYSPEFQVG